MAITLMSDQSQKVAFRLFHYTLACVVFILSTETVIHAWHQQSNLWIRSFAGLEALAALFFVIPKTVTLSGILLIAIFLFAFIFHAVHGEVNLPLLVYSAGVFLILNRR